MTQSWCILGPEMCKDSLCGPTPILLELEGMMVIYGTCWDELPTDVIELTPCDDYGVKLISVPVKYIARFLTSDEAEEELQKEEKHDQLTQDPRTTSSLGGETANYSH